MDVYKMLTQPIEGKIELKTFEFSWEIDVRKLENKMELLRSPIFQCLKDAENLTFVKWQVYFGVNKDDPSTHDWYSIFVLNMDKNDVKGKIGFTILNKNNAKVYERSLPFFNVKSHRVIGLPKFVEKSFILNAKNKVINDNKLTIVCKINTENDSWEVRPFSDVTITASGTNFYAHAYVLASRSHVFDSLFKTNTSEDEMVIDEEDIEFKVMREFLRFMYTGKVINIEQIACELLPVAEKYSVKELKTLCEDAMGITSYEDYAFKHVWASLANNASKAKSEFFNWMSLNLFTRQ